MQYENVNADLWDSISALKRQVILERNSCDSTSTKDYGERRNLSIEEVVKRIEETILTVTRDISEDRCPVLFYSSTSDWGDVSFAKDVGLEMKTNQRKTAVRYESLQSVRKFSLMLKVLAVMYRMVKTDRYCTKRDIFYQEPELFKNQTVLDGIVDNISCMLRVPRWRLHVLATSKGCVAGDLVFQDADDNYIDCRSTRMGIPVPAHVSAMHDIITNAKFILVVEKDATFQKLLSDNVCQKLDPCILVTGKGFPDLNTRLLLRRLWSECQIPVLGLVDADPHGIEIMAVYKFGSRSLSFETRHLAIPSLRWLGIFPSDIARLGIPEQVQIPFTKADLDKGRELLGRPYMKHYPLWQKEVEDLIDRQKKAEIQGLDAISPNFLADVYLPNKIRCAGWI